MTGHNQDEGSRFIQNTVVIDEPSYAAYLKSLITPLASNDSALNYITQVLYPPIFDGSQGYTTQAERNNLTIADASLVCNTRFLNQAAFRPPTYAYEWSVPPAVHQADLAYTFYDFGPSPGVNTIRSQRRCRSISRVSRKQASRMRLRYRFSVVREEDLWCRSWAMMVFDRCPMKEGSSSCRNVVDFGRKFRI